MPSSMMKFVEIVEKLNCYKPTSWQDVIDFFNGKFQSLTKEQIIESLYSITFSKDVTQVCNFERQYASSFGIPSLNEVQPSRYDSDFNDEINNFLPKQTSVKIKQINKDGKNIFYGTGRRKSAIARVFISKGTGNIIVNKMKGSDYFFISESYSLAIEPLRVLNLLDGIDIIATVKGGGFTGQAGAVQLGLSRALADLNSSHRISLKPLGYFTRDSRVSERKKSGLKKARKAPQFSKR